MGMKVLQFAFGDMDTPIFRNIISTPTGRATGTHDNNTSLGWYHESDEETKHRYRMVAGRDGRSQLGLDRLALSQLKWAIIPLQDVLGLDTMGDEYLTSRWPLSWRMHQVAQHDSDRLRSD